MISGMVPVDMQSHASFSRPHHAMTQEKLVLLGSQRAPCTACLGGRSTLLACCYPSSNTRAVQTLRNSRTRAVAVNQVTQVKEASTGTPDRLKTSSASSSSGGNLSSLKSPSSTASQLSSDTVSSSSSSSPINLVKPKAPIRPQRPNPPTPRPAPRPVQRLPIGEDVLGRVVWANEKGAKVQLLDYDVIGFMPGHEAPFTLLDNAFQPEESESRCIAVDVVRPFRVVRNVDPSNPLLSAQAVDFDVMWKRAEQLFKMSQVLRENIVVQVLEANHGGLVANFQGLNVFIPVSHVQEDREKKSYLSEEEMRSMYTGKWMEVALTQIDGSRKKLVASARQARDNTLVRAVQVGSLVWGTVRRLEPFGVFVGIDNTFLSGLLHMSNISRMPVKDARRVFKVDDRVLAVVMGVEAGYTNVSLSTAELEPNDGDMLREPAAVYEAAPREQRHFLEHLRNLRQAQATAMAEGREWSEDEYMQAVLGPRSS